MVKMMINADQARKLTKERKTVELDRFLKAVEEAVFATSNIGGHTCLWILRIMIIILLVMLQKYYEI